MSSKTRTLEQAVFLHIQKTADVLMGELVDLLKPHELSPPQYNVLRILRAAGAEGLPCGKITERMLTREPDMTRLLDRMENRRLIERWRDRQDRRVVRAKIGDEGLTLVRELDQPVLELHRRQLSNLNSKQLGDLAALLEIARERGGDR
jgi:DNA-binding MarR family transcriptional regulator